MQAFLSIIESYWSSHMNCPPAALSRPGVHVSLHGPALAGYVGAFFLYRDGSVVGSLPSSSVALAAAIQSSDVSVLQSPSSLASLFGVGPASVVGPAFLGYTDPHAFRPASGAARLLDISDAPAVEQLQQACTPTEWAHGGSSVLHQPAAGVFEDGRLMALAGYAVWGGSIAHIAIITHPEARGHGYARQAVSRVTEHALEQGLAPQYRTLEANQPSMNVAHALGFSSFGRSIAVRLGPVAA